MNRFVTFCGLLILVVLVGALFLYRQGNAVQTEGDPKGAGTQATHSDEVEFTWVLAGSMVKKKNGAIVSFRTFKSSDGVSVTTQIESYSSPALAITEMENLMPQGTRVLERSPKLNGRGLRVGERAVCQIGPPVYNEPGAAVIWTENKELHYLISPSLKHVLAFEKWCCRE